MIIRGAKISNKKIAFLIFYYVILYYLPSNGTLFIGRLMRSLRFFCCKNIFKFCGKNVNIERKANFGSGRNIIIGDNSGLGKNCIIPSNTMLGNNVMMGPNCYILPHNHIFERVDIPMIEQGLSLPSKTIIEDDVWIGRNVSMTAGRRIRRGSIIAMGCVLCKDFPAFSIIGGVPSRLIKSRIDESNKINENREVGY